jgi:hypothetical protein
MLSSHEKGGSVMLEGKLDFEELEAVVGGVSKVDFILASSRLFKSLWKDLLSILSNRPSSSSSSDMCLL